MRSFISFLAALALLVEVSDAFAFVPRNTLVAPKSCSSLQMKMFDWKRRGADEASLNDLDATQFTLDNLKPAPGSRHRKTRKGRGISAGQGATCGFGMRGQKARAGRPTRPGFEGGQTALYRRLPKFVGKPLGPGHTRTLYYPISTDVLAKVDAGSKVTYESLLDSKIISKAKYDLHKFVNGNSRSVAENITVQAHGFTASARATIEAAGGKCEILSPTTGEVLEPVEA